MMKKDLKELKKSIDKRFNGVDKRFNKVDKRFNGVDKRLSGVEKKLERLDKNILGYKGEIDRKIDENEQKNEKIILKFKNDVMNGLDKVMGELSTIREEQMIVGHQVSDHGTRITVLEQKSLAFS